MRRVKDGIGRTRGAAHGHRALADLDTIGQSRQTECLGGQFKPATAAAIGDVHDARGPDFEKLEQRQSQIGCVRRRGDGRTDDLEHTRLAGVGQHGLDVVRATAPVAAIERGGAHDQRSGISRKERTLTFELCPHVLYMLGFDAAIEWLAEKKEKRYGISFQYMSDRKDKPMDEDLKVFLFQAIRELMINVGKHAQATNANVTVRRDNGTVCVEVSDDGVGFDVFEVDSAEEDNVGFGLFSIRERLYHLGGSFEITSESGKGTRIRLTAPVRDVAGIERREAVSA